MVASLPTNARPALRILCLTALLVAGTASAVPTPEEIVQTVQKLQAVQLDSSRAFPADGQVLERPGLTATFTSGDFRPIAREDGRVVGLLFQGEGSIEIGVPAGVETTAWQSTTDFAPLTQTFDAAWLRYSDLTGFELRGEREWTEAGDPTGSAFRIHEARSSLLDDPLWVGPRPRLLVDRLRDLYGGDAAGGHLLAEFRVANDPAADWLSYHHNPRGALFPDETTAWYRVTPFGAAPPRVTVHASFGEHPASAPEYDVSFTELDITFPTSTRAGRNVADAEIVADIGLISLDPYGLEAVVFELAEERRLCNEQTDRPKLKVSSVKDQEGNQLAALHLGDRLVIPLAKPVPQGEAVNLTIAYAGAVTQGTPVGPPDTSFSEIGPWAFYPRSLRHDRFASKVSLHLPRYLRGVAPGELTEVREEKEGWHYTFEEPGGVAVLTVVVGDLVRSKPKDEGSNPRVITWMPRTDQEYLSEFSKASVGMVDALANLWGPYPYSTLHVVTTTGFPFRNWAMGADGESGQWTCLPPGPVHPWQAYAQQPSTMQLSGETTPPSWDVIEARYLENYLEVGVKTPAYISFMKLARQWWGHMVPPRSYRDQWLIEALVGWTGLAFIRGAAGESAVKERARLLREMIDLAAESKEPLGIGPRMGHDFFYAGWGIGPLVVNTLIDQIGNGPFATTLNGLVNRASGPGLSTELLLESLPGGEAGKRSRALIEGLLAGTAPPTVEYSVDLDKDTGVVKLAFEQLSEPLPIEIGVELVYGPKDQRLRVVSLEGPLTEVEWSLDEVPKRVVVDPLNLALVRSLKKRRAVGGAEE